MSIDAPERPASSAAASPGGVVTHSYAPRGACRQLLQDRGPEVLVSGPAGTGKSRACLEKLNLVALANPGMRGLIVRKTQTSLTSTALVTWREHVIKEALNHGVVTYYGGSNVEPAQYRYANGSKVMVGGMDKSTRIMSSEYDLIYVQEATELTTDNWEALTTRLRNGRVSFQQLIADCNPDSEHHWLFQRSLAGSTRMLHSRHEDNPVLFGLDGVLTAAGTVYLGRLDALTGVRLHRLRHGRWVSAEGVIYEEYDQGIHLVDRFDIPRSWTRWWTVDFGYTNPFVLQCWAEDPDGRLYRYREVYRTKRLVEDHAAEILAIVCPNGTWSEPKPRAIICDHDAEDRATLTKHLGMSTVPAKKSVTTGIQAVQSRFRSRRLFLLRDSVHGRDPELVEARKPTCTEEEIPGYVWADGKETPVKEDDHGCDATRYMVAHRDLVTQSSVRFV